MFQDFTTTTKQNEQLPNAESQIRPLDSEKSCENAQANS